MKLLRVADVRYALDMFEREEISYTKMVDILNEKANEKLRTPKISDILIAFLKWQVDNHRYHSLKNEKETVDLFLSKDIIYSPEPQR